jgi:hypothetical protein
MLWNGRRSRHFAHTPIMNLTNYTILIRPKNGTSYDGTVESNKYRRFCPPRLKN